MLSYNANFEAWWRSVGCHEFPEAARELLQHGFEAGADDDETKEDLRKRIEELEDEIEEGGDDCPYCCDLEDEVADLRDQIEELQGELAELEAAE